MKKKKKIEIPTKTGWYWIVIVGWATPIACWFYYNENEPDESYFLPGGVGDESSNGVYIEDVEKIGPEIIQPDF